MSFSDKQMSISSNIEMKSNRTELHKELNCLIYRRVLGFTWVKMQKKRAELGLLNEVDHQCNVFPSHGMKVSIERAWD